MSDNRTFNSDASEDLDNVQSTNLLAEKNKESPDIPCCGCMSVRYYQPYFDVDTVDITSRISSSMLYCRREQNFLSSIQDKPDAYGPFWVRFKVLVCSCEPILNTFSPSTILDCNHACIYPWCGVAFEWLALFLDEWRNLVRKL